MLSIYLYVVIWGILLSPVPICLMNVKLDNFTSTIIRSTDIQPSFKMHHAIDCTWNITAPASRRVCDLYIVAVALNYTAITIIGTFIV